MKMSDPVTNVEIEDVLTSIRRLVSVEDREKADDRHQADDGEGPAAQRRENGEKLVLTPSLRVDDAAEELDGVSTHEPPDFRSAREAPAEPEGFEPAGPEQWMTLDEVAESPVQTGDSEEERGVTDALHPDPAAKSGPERRAEELKARVAEFEALVAAREEQWEPDGETPDPNAGEKGHPLPWEDSTPDDFGGGATEDDEDAAPASGPDDAWDEGDAADWEVASSNREDDATAIETDNMPEPEERETPEARGFAADPDPDGAGRDDDRADDDYLSMSEDALDEEALRDLVTEIVRQELQGALGERITRNVRKLVRREIHRALAAQDLD